MQLNSFSLSAFSLVAVHLRLFNNFGDPNGLFDAIKNLSDASSRLMRSLDVGRSMRSFRSLLWYINWKINALLHCWNSQMRLYDVDSGSPATEQNLENVFQLILRINFRFFWQQQQHSHCVQSTHSRASVQKMIFSISYIHIQPLYWSRTYYDASIHLTIEKWIKNVGWRSGVKCWLAPCSSDVNDHISIHLPLNLLNSLEMLESSENIKGALG